MIFLLDVMTFSSQKRVPAQIKKLTDVHSAKEIITTSKLLCIYETILARFKKILAALYVVSRQH